MVNLPEDFVRETRLVMGEERFNRFLGAFDEEAPTSIRVNPKYALAVGERERVAWCEEGYYLEGRPQFTFDPLFHAGCYYVQEASSMFITHVLRTLTIPEQSSPARTCSLCLQRTRSLSHLSSLNCLDLCAAPGGKSTAMRTVLPEGSTLVSNEPIGNRAQILLENITKCGWPDCIVTNNYPRDFRKAKAKFDVILCDVPCSGEGMFRKDPATISEWSLQNVEKCWRLQREIVADAWECLNPGGLLIYSTCTFNTKENEENIRWILDTFDDARVIPIETRPEWNITGSLLNGFDQPVYRFIPGISRGEGLFVCVLRKQVRNAAARPSAKNLSSLNHLLSPFLLHQPSAVSHQPSAISHLSYPEAMKFLRGESLTLPPDTPRGIVEVCFDGHPLGTMKNIGTRANNLYPKEWRIKTTHIPNEYEPILQQI